jgi:hypothetical protein
MNKTLAALTATSLIFCTLAISLSGELRPPARVDKNAQPVVVELFTSEGCSSCPPADALLLKLEAAQPVANANVIALEEHVDYWNHDGWTDPFSSADWTARQVEYVTRFKDKSPYTPQMIVNGETQLLGTEEQQVEQVVQQAAAQPKTEVILTLESPAPDGSQQIKVRVGKLMGSTDRDTAEVWLAVTESGLASSVSAGENAGRDLHHASVVRSLHKIGLATPQNDSAFEASTRVKYKSSWKRQNLQVVVFLQEKKSMRILGAAAVTVNL